MSKRKDIIKRHNHKITESKNGKWMTWVDDNSSPSQRKKIVKKTENDLLDALILHYRRQEQQITLESYYPIWFNYKNSITASASTMRRHDQHWSKYYKDTPITRIPLQDLTAIQLTTWAHDIIKANDFSSKNFQNMKIIMTGILQLAKLNDVITTNPWDDVIINPRFYRVVHKKPNSERVYLEEELNSLKNELFLQLSYKPECSAPYALLLQLYLGVRIGELVALKFSDIKDNYIHIQRMERKCDILLDGKWGKQYYDVVDHIKTHNDVGERFIYLTTGARDVITKIKTLNDMYGYYDDNYIFVDSNGRMNSRQIACRLERYCGHIGLDRVKSTHSIRRTVASLLSVGNVPLDEIRRMFGHSDEKTTLGYIYNPYSAEKTENLIESALG